MPETDLFTVSGRIFDASTKQGLGNLLVTAFDVAAADQRGPSTLPELSKRATRIGSVTSDDLGRFQLTYGGSDLPSRGEAPKANLLLVVSAPEDDSGDGGEKVLYFSNPPRWGAGRTETFNVGISRASQRKFSLGNARTVAESVGEYRDQHSDDLALKNGVVELQRDAVKKDMQEKATLRSQLVARLATNIDIASFPGEVLRHGDRILDKVRAVGERAMNLAGTQINGTRGVPVNLYLGPADRARLASFFDAAVDGFATIPESALGDVLFRRDNGDEPGTLLIHQNPITSFCAAESFDQKCAQAHTGIAGEEHAHDEDGGAGGGNPTGPGIETLLDEDVPSYVARLVGAMPSPDSVLSAPFNSQRPDRAAVQNSVDAFSLRKGPAETAAFYDFHSLQIAFEHVWQILLDENLIDQAHTLDQTYLAKTGVSLTDRFSGAWANVLTSGNLQQSVLQEVPADVAAQFDISLEEWIDLSASHQKKLRELSSAIASACEAKQAAGSGIAGLIFGSRPRRRLDCEHERQALREQGDRIIDAVRHDDYATMHRTLRELRERMNGKYEFTVFAADNNFHSVNFGLLNTYRQEWVPVEYQAGKLVKTIALSPKEERKYSLKVSRTLKHARKEALKNSSATAGEQSSTSRVEAEIMAKAQSKTNFGLSAEGSYNIGISKGKSTTTFGVEAQQESANTRKDFREAVVKATQEYKEERNLDIETEATDSYEYNESGTIVNPNDELSVTYLFYELERRYRVSEQLFRTLPVVLVAEPVPAPHQITESWVIANDWVINRYLLDDSFRPALQYLANKSVGDDFALRELRRNLRQQRNLVETLRIELSIASGEADNRYRALESAIERRIGEESAEKTDGWFSDVGDFFGGGGQDPEAAKARELAAKDAHQYAVEKAEKAAAALRQEMGSLHALTAQYNDTLRTHLDNETRVSRLLVHIRNNVFHYMQAIWSMEPPDQRFLRLHKVQVPVLATARVADPANPGSTVPDRQYQVEVTPSPDIFGSFRAPGTTKHKAFLRAKLEPVTEFRPLVEVADLDNPLGFKGNYAIFPLKEHNALTELMAAPYVDAAFGAMDPDQLSNVNLEDYSKYVCCLHERLSQEEFEALKPQLKAWLERLLASPLRNGDELVVPTSSLFIEVLPGAHPLLENYKLRHRELDVYKAQADVRKAELENLRLAARLVNHEREDPDIEKKIVVQGGVTPNIDVDNP